MHGKNGKLITSGMGKAGQIAHNIATTFSSTGTPRLIATAEVPPTPPSEAQCDTGWVEVLNFENSR